MSQDKLIKLTNKDTKEVYFTRKNKKTVLKKIDLYSPTKKFFKKVLLSSGQCFVLLKGGWSITFLEPSEIFEFKNGPFVQDKILID
jgi:hypothetical protein